MSDLHEQTASPYSAMLTLTYGETPTVKRYIRYTENVSFGGEEFASAPSLEIKLEKQHGGTDDAPAEIRVRPEEGEPFASLAKIYAFPKVKVKIEECIPGDIDSRHELFYGHIGIVTTNPAGGPGILKLSVKGVKAGLDSALGFSATISCPYKLGDGNCKKDFSAMIETGTVVGLQWNEKRNRLLVRTPEWDFSDDRLWQGNAFLERDDLRMTIAANQIGVEAVDWVADTAYEEDDWISPSSLASGFRFIVTEAGTSSGTEPTWTTSDGDTFNDDTYLADESDDLIVDESGDEILVDRVVWEAQEVCRMDMVRIPPPSWLDQEVTASPADDKSIEMCREIYDNEENFGGVGFNMPNRNPLLEE